MFQLDTPTAFIQVMSFIWASCTYFTNDYKFKTDLGLKGPGGSEMADFKGGWYGYTT